MPFYEYICKNCGHELEVLQKFSDNPLVECPNCKQNELSKKISAPAFHLKGDGWYVTDFKDKKPPKTEAKTDIKAETKTEKPAEKKADE